MFGVNDVAMMLCAGNFRVALLTEHIPVTDIGKYITRENILSKLSIVHKSLQKDFGIDKPRIAVLGLNPHAGDEGLIGSEEESVIKPAIRDAKNNNMLVVGPFSADAFLPGEATSSLTPCSLCTMTRGLFHLNPWPAVRE